jgi:predicted 2-oxoglutarate/Fe(II)-dependent dioxygenase YbiX
VTQLVRKSGAAPHKGIEFEEAAIVIYSVGAEVPAHTDVNFAKRGRILSFILYLTDGYEGGELCIPTLGHFAAAPAGHVKIFPSIELHWATPIRAGVKSVVVGFYSDLTGGAV